MAALRRQLHAPGLDSADSDPKQTAHRSVTVQKIATLSARLADSNTAASAATSNRSLVLAQLWSQCASPTPYTSSVATGAIVDLVLKDALDWSDAVQGCENAMATCQGQALANLTHALTRLFVIAAEITSNFASKTNAPSTRTVFASKNNRHPFIALITIKPQAETLLFAAMDTILDHRPDSAPYRIAALDILAPFLDFCMLDRQERTGTASSSTILWISRTLHADLLDNDLEPFVIHLLDYLYSVPSRSPLDRTQQCASLQAILRTLVGLYCLPSTQLSLSATYKEALGSRLLLILLSWMADMRRFGLATLPLMQTIQQLFRSRKGYTAPTLDFDTLWPLLSFLLMNSPTVDEQCIIVDWMYATLTTTKETRDAMVANLAFLPIFQVMGETHSDATSKKCSEMLQKLETIPRTTEPRTRLNNESLHTSGVAAMLQAEVVHLRQVWSSSVEDESGTAFSLGDDATLASLVLTTFMFHPDENKRISAVVQQAQVEEGRLVTLVLFIYVLRVDPSPLVKLQLLQEAIPSLVSSKDETVTAKILRTILTLIHGVPNAPTGAKIKSSHMGAVGVRILFLIWKRQPRVWKTLRHVIHEWVEGRPRLFKTPVKGDPEYDMEVAILTTIRDVCAVDAAGYAEVLIPFLASLLGSVELYASSICTIIETMNLTVEANVVEPRAAWNVLLCHVAEHAMKARHPGLLQEMCIFYGIVGSRSEDTQVFLDLREAILTNYIQPLLSFDDPEVLASALKALSHYSASEILSSLPTESPAVYIRDQILDCQDSMVVDEYSMILDKLVRYELLHMRRGLFKDAASKKASPDALSGARELDRLQGVLSVIAGNILQKWVSGDVNPGLRTGYALSGLLCSSVVDKKSESTLSEVDPVGAIKAQQGYRNMMTAIKDVTLTDHLVERISAMEGWTSLFDDMWVPNDDAQTLTIAETLVADLYKKITEGYVPAHCANALFAITGITLSLHRHSHPASTVQSSILAKHLLQNYVRPETLSDVGGSDEVQFAVLVSLSFITPLAAVDEKLVAEVLAVLTDRLNADIASPGSSSDLSSWSSFATGWAFCNLLAGLVDSPTKTAELNAICHQTLDQLVAVLDSDTASFALTLGIMIAFPRLSVAIASSSSQRNKDSIASVEAEAVEKIKTMATACLDAFVSDQQKMLSPQALARLLGAPWVIAFSDAVESSLEDRKADTELLDRALLAATSRRDLQSQLIHFTVPFCHLIHINLDVRNPTSSEISLFTSRIHSLVNLIRITPTAAARHTAVVALGSLFGINWSRGPMITSVGSHGLFSYLTSSTNPAAMASVTNLAVTTLTELARLSISITAAGSGDAALGAFAVVVPGHKAPSPKAMLMIQDLKAGRLASVVLGHVACLVHRLGQVDSGKVIGTSSEPKDYSRLAVSTSWLRGLWDALWIPLQMGTVQRAQKSYAASLELLLYTVHSLPTPLPAVNWFPLLTQLVTMEPRLIVPALQMASKHAMTSTSLMEFLIMTLSNFKADRHSSAVTEDNSEGAQSVEELLVGEEGLGRILTLGGLPLLDGESDRAQAELDKVRGLEGLAKRVTLPNSRVTDLVERLIKALFFNLDGTQRSDQDPETEVLQLVFLDTLSNHMRQHRQGEKATLGRKAVSAASTLPDQAKELLGELRSVLLRVFYQVDFEQTMTAQRVLRRLADLTLMSISHLDAAQLDSTVSGQDQPDAGARVLKEAIGIASLYRSGYLNSSQEGRLMQVAQSALLIMSTTCVEASYTSLNRQLAESAISVLLYAMNASAGLGSTAMTSAQQRRRNSRRVTWLQRILDLLVLLSSQRDIFRHGLTLLLGGAVLLWWEDKGKPALRQQDVDPDDPAAAMKRTGPAEEAEANFLALTDDHELQSQFQQGDGHAAAEGMDYNIVEDDRFEMWHQRFVQSVSLYDSGGPGSEDLALQEERRWSVSSRMGLVLPDIVLNIRGAGSSAGDVQIASRLLGLMLDPHVETSEKQTVIVLLRRMEELVPATQSWVLR
ncbi:hypothetical protein BGZ70_009662 [Mortierella alpina]|uniref:DUF3730 domain-containing protein n=1 Tax=Mortierella alpina TaxID=64518 RepID=A0A9P6JD46_MORAP|nr:hypothetical protein BGZ70_009662 [Mortierella alpina]